MPTQTKRTLRHNTVKPSGGKPRRRVRRGWFITATRRDRVRFNHRIRGEVSQRSPRWPISPIDAAACLSGARRVATRRASDTLACQ